MQTYQYMYQGDSLAHLREMPDQSFDLIVTDPPYFNVLSASEHGIDSEWDRQWSNKEAYLAWLSEYIQEFKRLLKPNGSIYLFCSSAQQAAIETHMGEGFEVLNSIVWHKQYSYGGISCKEALRRYVIQKEHCIFAESKNSDAWAYSGANNDRALDKTLDEQRGMIFEPIRKYLADSWYGAGLTFDDAKKVTSKDMPRHWFTTSQWTLPTRKQYEKLQAACANLKTQYDALKTQYDALRRTMQLSAAVPYTDVWTYKSLPSSKSRHVCEKPLEMMLDIINASSKPGDRVLDAFAGSGVVGDACAQLGRNFVGIEMQLKWAARATNRMKKTDIFDTCITEL